MLSRLLVCLCLLILAASSHARDSQSDDEARRRPQSPPTWRISLAPQIHDANGVFVGIATTLGANFEVFDRQLGGVTYSIDSELARVVEGTVLFEEADCTGRAFHFSSGPRQRLVSNPGGTDESRYWLGIAPNEAEIETLSLDDGSGTCEGRIILSEPGRRLELMESTDQVAGKFERLTPPLHLR